MGRNLRKRIEIVPERKSAEERQIACLHMSRYARCSFSVRGLERLQHLVEREAADLLALWAEPMGAERQGDAAVCEPLLKENKSCRIRL